MATRIKGRAVFEVDFLVDEEMLADEAEQRFNEAIQSLFDYGNVVDARDDNSSVDYTQRHEYSVLEEDE